MNIKTIASAKLLVLASVGTGDVLDLPATGITGNSHMLMMDRNSDQIAARMQWSKRDLRSERPRQHKHLAFRNSAFPFTSLNQETK